MGRIAFALSGVALAGLIVACCAPVPIPSTAARPADPSALPPDLSTDDPLSPDERPEPTDAPMADHELKDRGQRMNQPHLRTGQKVVIRNSAAFADGRFGIRFREKGPNRMAPNGVLATVLDDPTFGGFFAVKVRIESGRHIDKEAWVSRGDIDPVPDVKRK